MFDAEDALLAIRCNGSCSSGEARSGETGSITLIRIQEEPELFLICIETVNNKLFLVSVERLGAVGDLSTHHHDTYVEALMNLCGEIEFARGGSAVGIN